MESKVPGTYWGMKKEKERIKDAQVSDLGDWVECGDFFLNLESQKKDLVWGQKKMSSIVGILGLAVSWTIFMELSNGSSVIWAWGSGEEGEQLYTVHGDHSCGASAGSQNV